MASSCMVYNAVICVFLCVAICNLEACLGRRYSTCVWTKGYSPVKKLIHGYRYKVYTMKTCHYVECEDGHIQMQVISGCQALRQARASLARVELWTERYLQISGWISYPLSLQHIINIYVNDTKSRWTWYNIQSISIISTIHQPGHMRRCTVMPKDLLSKLHFFPSPRFFESILCLTIASSNILLQLGTIRLSSVWTPKAPSWMEQF
ncbi:hypothetical protein PoB_002457800 [Plakobranchus ocellatus]|uniref:Uncharacterized protein n=1 Tax=Plakobranchus ocellatus TaxID=259542 RepID=A0AAV3ZTB7_9GAST|nr:hypothetical protein PoB_002457800 [Plakobranchus ocellatus]